MTADLLFTAEPRLLLVAFAAVVAGFVRGFSGFGGAMIFVPLASAAYEPKVAIVWAIMADNLVSWPLLPPAFKKCHWREIIPMVAGAAIGTPLGVQALRVVDSDVLRWVLCVAILATVVLLAGGLGYRGRLSWPGSVGVGGLSGLAGGAIGISGPPVALLWVGGQYDARQARANLIAYFGLLAVATTASWLMAGLITPARLVESLLLAPLYGLPLLLGTRFFARSTDAHFRYGALLICTTAALIGLPVWR